MRQRMYVRSDQSYVTASSPDGRATSGNIDWVKSMNMRALELNIPRTRGRVERATRDARIWLLVMLGVAFADSLALIAAFAGAYVIRFWSGWEIFRSGAERPEFYVWIVLWALPIWLTIFVIYRLYDRRELFVGFREYQQVGNACTIAVLMIIVVSFFLEMPDIARAWLLLAWVLTTFVVCGARFLIRHAIRQARRSGRLVTPTVIVGANEEGQALAEQLSGNSGSGADVLGLIVSGETEATISSVGKLPILGSLNDLDTVVDVLNVCDIIVATTALTREQLLELYRRFAHNDDVELRLSSGLFAILTTGVRVQEISGVPLMTLHRVRITGIDALLKAALDSIGALIMLLVLSPVMFAVALLVKYESRGAVLHRRRVLGQNGKPFDAYKFRTMIPDRRVKQVPIQMPDRRRADKVINDPRVTPIGRFLRRTSLDELPQLINVLRGEMSLVGPRIIVPDEVRLYGKWQLNLLTVKPGITGPWQIRGRAAIPYDERVRLSMEYIRNYSIWLDLEILLRTIPAVLMGKGAY
jgi:exopolysaccharide biosynthesis polyprenyl glycosylphosphotransferase